MHIHFEQIKTGYLQKMFFSMNFNVCNEKYMNYGNYRYVYFASNQNNFLKIS